MSKQSNSVSPSDPKFVKIGDAAQILGVSIDTLRRWEKSGKLETVRTPGGTRLYSRQSLENFQPKATYTEPPSQPSSSSTPTTEELLESIQKDITIENTDPLIPEAIPETPIENVANPIKIYAKIYANGKSLSSFFSYTLIITALAAVTLAASSLKPLFSPSHNQAEVAGEKKVLTEIQSSSDVLAVTSAASFLEINTESQINGNLSVRNAINGLTIEASPSSSTFALTSGTTTLTLTNTTNLDQDVSTSSSPTFNSLNLSATKDQLVFQSGGPTGTLTWTPTSEKIITLPDATGEVSLLGQKISNSELDNSKVTVTAGSNLSGGGDVNLGSSVTLALKDSPAIAGVLSLADGTAAAPALSFTNDADTGLYRIGANNIALITGGTSTQGISIDSSGNLGVGNITPSAKLYVSGNVGIGFTSSSVTVPNLGLAVSGNIGIGTTTANSTLSVAGSAHIGGLFQGIAAPANGLFVDGNVGIGATSTAYNLDVWGTGRFTGALTLDGGLTMSGNLGVGGSLTVTSVIAANGGFKVTGFSDLTGNVGIGSSLSVTSASVLDSLSVTKSISSATLGVTGATTLQGALTANGVFTLGDGGDSGSINTSDWDISTTGDLSGIGTITSDGTLTLSGVALDITTLSNEHLTLIPNGTGNVGIGYSSPYGKLFVLGQGTGTGINFQTTSAAQTQGLTVLDNGNVGIGTTNPGFNLQVIATGNFGNLGVGGSLVTSGNVGVGASLTVTSAAALSTLNVSGISSLQGINAQSLTTSGNIGVGLSITSANLINTQGLNVTGASSLGTAYAGTLTTSGNAGIGASLSVIGTNTIGVFDRLRVNTLADITALNVSGNLGVGSSITGFGALSGLNVSGATSLSSLGVSGASVLQGALTLNNSFTLGDNGETGSINTSDWDISTTGDLSGIGTITSDGTLTLSGVALDITTGPNEALTLIPNGTGNVGIGTSNINANFQILGKGTGTGLNFLTTGSTQIQGLAVLDNGNVGIGTTGPTDKLIVSGGNVGIGVSSPLTNLAVQGSGVLGWGVTGVAGPANGLAVSGNVGVGTTSPIGALHVVGQCVTEGTRIRRRRRGSGTQGKDDEWEDIPVEDIRPDDEVLSLNDKTGEWEWNKVEATLNKGIQTVYRLETEGGKWIDTTSEHPYLVKVQNAHQKTALTAALVNLTGMLNGWTDTLNVNISQNSQSVKSDNLSVDSPGIEPGRFGVSIQPSKPAEPTPLLLSQDTNVFSTKWIKVSQLKTGMKIATVDGWEKISNIYRVGRKQTYDLQIENTHNFVGNDIVAHNTYINGNLGIGANFTGVTTPSNGLAVQGNVGVGTTTPAGLLDISKAVSATPSLTGQYLSMSASTLTDNGTAASGTLTNAVFNSIAAPTLAATNLSVTTTNAYGLYLGGAPIKGTNETITNTTALNIASAAVGVATNSYGLQVNAQTGANNNYAAVFSGGNVGIGATAPAYKLDVLGDTQIKGILNITEGSSAVTSSIQSKSVAGSGFLYLQGWGNEIAFTDNTTLRTTNGTTNGGGPLNFQVNTVNFGTGTGGVTTLRFGYAANTANWYSSTTSTFGLIPGSQLQSGVGVQGQVTLAGALNQNDVLIKRNVTAAFTESGSLLALQKDITGSSTYNSNYLQWGTTATTLGVIDKSGNVGIGTISPGSLLSVNGNALVGYSGTSAAPANGLAVQGNVGVGTTSPIGALHVVGQCVTGDTLLKRRRRRKNSKGEWEDDFEDVQIKDIQPGDEILTLDESTGKFVTSRVKALMDMGKKDIIKITTVSGKTIRTTSEHPYLVNLKTVDQTNFGTNFLYHQTFEYIQKTAFEFYKKVLEGQKIKVPALDNQEIYFSREGWNHLVEEKKGRFETMARFFALPKVPFVLGLADRTAEAPITITLEGDVITFWAVQGIIEGAWVKVVIRSINNGPLYFHSAIWKGEEHRNEVKNAIKKGAVSRLYPRRQASKKLLAFSTFNWKQYNTFVNKLQVQGGKKNTLHLRGGEKWVKVKNLSVGAEIATIDGWEQIQSIEHLPREQVFDIEVENTHNFVGNDIVAHNTYLNGNVGIGPSTTISGSLIVSSGNVGIGGTSAAYTLDTWGTGRFTGALTLAGNLGIGGSITSANLINTQGLNVSDAAVINKLYVTSCTGCGGVTSSSTLQIADGTATAPSYSFSADTNTGMYRVGADALALIVGGPTGGGLLSLNTTGVGIGTTSPTQQLQVNGNTLGQCVAVGTRIRRRRKKKNGEWEEEEVPVEDIKPDDEVLSLNDKTGEWEWHKVEKTMDKGRQETIKIVTQSGKWIETTSEHPYLTIEKDIKSIPESGKFEVDLSSRMEKNTDTYVAVANKIAAEIIRVTALEKQTLKKLFGKTPRLFPPTLYALCIVEIIRRGKVRPSQLKICTDYPSHERRIEAIINYFYPGIVVNFGHVGHGTGSYADRAAYQAFSQKKKTGVGSNLKGFPTAEQLHDDWLHRSTTHTVLSRKHYHKLTDLSIQQASWKKVKYLKPGMWIATVSGWEQIQNKYSAGRKQTYDLQIEGTHNFVGGHYVDSRTNTPLTGEQEQLYSEIKNLELGTTHPSFGGRDLDQILDIAARHEINLSDEGLAARFGRNFEGNISQEYYNHKYPESNINFDIEVSKINHLFVSFLNLKATDNKTITNPISVVNKLTLTQTSGWDENKVVINSAKNPAERSTNHSDNILNKTGSNFTISTLPDGKLPVNLQAAKQKLIQALSSKLQVPLDAVKYGGIVAHNTFVVTSGGNVGIGFTSPQSLLEVQGNGETSSWKTNSRSLPVLTVATSSVVANGYVYVIGGCNSTTGNGCTSSNRQSTVYYAKLNGDGTVGSWNTNSNYLPITISTSVSNGDLNGHNTVVTNGYIYVLGGVTGTNTSLSSVYYAKINSDGSTGTWQTNTNSLLLARAQHSSVTANGYMYVLGGSGASTVYYSKINSDGSLGTWNTNSNALPEVLLATASVTANGYMYVIGGDPGTNAGRSTVLYAKINSDGSVGSWNTNSIYLPARRSATNKAVVANGYIYLFGGLEGSTGRSTVYYSKINSDGSLGTWNTNSNSLPTERTGNGLVVANGYVYVLGGSTDSGNGATSSTVYYTSLQRVSIQGNLDLLGLAGANVGDSTGDSSFGSVGGSIYAGNIFSAGALEVSGNSQFWNGAGFMGPVSIGIGASNNSNNLSPIFNVTRATTLTGFTDSLFSIASNGNIGIGGSVGYILPVLSKLGIAGNVGIGPSSAVARLAAGTYLALDGNLGVGTTTASNALSVFGAANIGNRLGATSPTNGLLVSGNVGIGTTGLGSSNNGSFNLDVWGTGRFTGALTLDSTLTVAGGCTGCVGSSATLTIGDGTATAPSYSFSADTNTGLYRVGADALALIVGGPTNGDLLSLNTTGVGIGTTSPTQQLQVNGNTLGQCVAVGTRIRRRRRRRGSGAQGEDDWIEEEVPVEDILPGDEVLSLNDIAGEFEWHQVEKTWDKGIQDVYKIYTRSGLSIETTREHPYLVKMKAGKPETLPLGGTFEIDQSPKIEQLTKDSFIAIANEQQVYVLKVSKDIKKQLLAQFKSKETKNFAPLLFGKSIAALIKLANISPDRLIVDKDFPGYDSLVEEMIIQSFPKVSVEFKSVGRHSPAHIAAYKFVNKKLSHKKTTVIPFEGTIALLHTWPNPEDSQIAHGLFSPLYHKGSALSSKDTEWVKVSHLKPGMIIATLKGWEPIRTIYHSGRVQTYDLQIEGTHNFVGNDIVAHNTFVVTSGGNVGIGFTTPTSLLHVQGDGSTGGWKTNSNSIPVATQVQSSISANGYIYIIGGSSNITAYSAVYYARLNSDGSVGSWTTNSNSLPAVRQGHTSVVANGYVYVVGGCNQAGTVCQSAGQNQSTVFYAKINSDGSIGTWSTNSNYLPLERATHSTVVANGYVYVIGGCGDSASPCNSSGRSTVFYAKLNSDGSVGSWTTNSNYLPAARYTQASVVANGYVYVMGGGNGNSNYFSTVFYAKLNSDGSVGSWTTNSNSIPVARGYLSTVVANGYVYAIGGCNGTNCGTIQSTVFYAKLNSDGSAGTWNTNSNYLPGIRYGSSSVIANGYVYVLGGCSSSFNCGLAHSTVFYAPLAQVNIAANLNLLGLTGANVGDGAGDYSSGSMGGSIYAGNIFSAGALEVSSNSQFWQGAGFQGAVNIGVGAAFPGTSPLFSVTSANSSAALNSAFTVMGNGNVGVGTTSPTAPFEVKTTGTGTIAKFTSNNTTGCTLADGGTITCTSDVSLKKNILNLPYGLDEVMKLHPVEYNWKGQSDDAGKSLGFIAQEVEEIIPQLVSTNSDGLKELNTIGMVPILTRAIQQQQAQIASISAKLTSLTEEYPASEEVEEGDVVAIATPSDSVPYVQKSQQPYDQKILGIISTRPGILLSGFTDGKPVALAGRVPVKVSSENGPIQAGDYLTSSSIPGVAMKATRPGQVVGKALEEWDPTSGKDKILVFVNITFADPGNFLASLSFDEQGNLIIPKIKTGSIILDESLATSSASLTSDGTSLAYHDPNDPQSFYQSTAPPPDTSYDLSDKIASLEDRIAALEELEKAASSSASLTTDLDLTPPDILLATGSATLANLTVTSEATISGMLAAYDLNISNSLKSLGTTTLGKTTIAGDLTVDGTLSVENGTEINVIGTLYLQKSALASGLDIFGGKVTVDTSGNIRTAGELTAAKVKTNQLTISNLSIASSSATLAATIGTGVLPAGQTRVTINSSDIANSSKAFITPITSTDKVLSVTNISKGASFDVSVTAPAPSDIKFNWWVVQTE